MLGVSTIGNATLIAYDGNPILATDPWFGDEDYAYFGSWRLSHQIPPDCRRDILAAKHIWFSHGHPDHLNPASVGRLKGKSILLPDHVGGRIASDLREGGFDVTILPDRQWVPLSSRIRIFCITTTIQDALLLVDVNGRLFVDMNDAGTRDCFRVIKKTAANYRHSYLLSLSGYGDADMINLFNEGGARIVPDAALKRSVGAQLSSMARLLGLRSVVPFSSFHEYQRSDSIWAQQYVTPIDAYAQGMVGDLEFVPPFSHIDCVTGNFYGIDPAPLETGERAPEEFGDNWSDPLEKSDLPVLTDYFARKDVVRDSLSFINLRVGGADNFIGLDGKKDKGITFEVPRASLMEAVKLEIFDDLLIGNFMKTTLHNMPNLYDEDFNFAVTKYGDNGRAQSHAELREYFRQYRRRIGFDWYYEKFMLTAGALTIAHVPRNSGMYSVARRAYRFLRNL